MDNERANVGKSGRVHCNCNLASHTGEEKIVKML